MASLSVQPNQNAKLTLSNYRVAQSPNGGWNYFFNDKPITREAYAAGSGLSARADPSVLAAEAVGAPSNPNNNAPTYANKSNDIAAQLAYLNAEDTKNSAGTAAINTSLGRLNGTYDAETTANEGDYTTNSQQNQGNLQKNKQTALVNAAQGRQGLSGTLASLGALNGSGIDLMNRAVTNGANEDLAGAAENYSTNQGALDTSIGTYRQQDKERRDAAETAAADARTNLANSIAQERAGMYSKLADDYSSQGDSANAKLYADKIIGLAPQIAATSIPTTSLAPQTAAYTPTSLANYMAGANSTQVTTAPSNGAGGTPGLIAAPTKKRVLQPA